MEIANLFQLEDGRQIQNIVIADATGTATLSLWENFVHLVMLDKSYKFFYMVIKPFNGTKTIYTPKICYNYH